MTTLVTDGDSIAQIIANSQIFSQRFQENVKVLYRTVRSRSVRSASRGECRAIHSMRNNRDSMRNT